MTVKELITYLLNFKMSSNVVFVDENENKHELTTSSDDYLGNGIFNNNTKEVKLVPIRKEETQTIRDFKIGDRVKVTNEYSDLYGMVGTINAISERNGGTLLFSPPDTVLVMFLENGKSFGEALSIHSILKIGEKEFNNSINSPSVTYFISGHRDITQEEFDYYYLPLIDEAVAKPNSTFVVGDYHGVDTMAQEALSDMVSDPKRVTVYHMFEKPRNLVNDRFNTKGGFKTDDERDAAMTHDSDFDIAWIRKGKEKSGTAQNILRRYTFKTEE